MQTSVLMRHRRHDAPDRHRSVVSLALAGPSGSLMSRVLTNAVVVAGSLLLAASAMIHLYLWADGYRHVPTIGPLFLAQGIAGLTLAVALIAFPRTLVSALAAGVLGASVAALLISAHGGLFGFHDTLDAPWASTSLVVESVGAVLLAVGASLPLRAP